MTKTKFLLFINLILCFTIWIRTDISPEILEKYRTEKYCSHSIDNPLKAVSSYKVGELRDICSLLGIESSEIEKKPHL